ncbi:MAG: hypothetical protein L0229_27350 [Blastocatellia bacterium]|nr:hypothetical protein [Blastocatellia bacterium]
MAESFDIWNLSTKNLQKAIESGKFPSYKTRYQHHQILLDNSAKACALSQKPPSGVHKVFNVAISKVAGRIDEAITHLEKEEKDDSRVRLLVIRPFWIYAFWLVDRKQVYLISVSARIRGLKAGQQVSTSKLLRVLNKNINRFEPKEEQKRKRRRMFW